MIRACLLVLAGGLAAQHSRVPLSLDLCKLLFVAAAVLIVWRRTRLGAWLLFGFALFMQAGQGIIAARLDPQFAGDSILTEVRVVEFPKVSRNSTVMIVEPVVFAVDACSVFAFEDAGCYRIITEFPQVKHSAYSGDET